MTRKKADELFALYGGKYIEIKRFSDDEPYIAQFVGVTRGHILARRLTGYGSHAHFDSIESIQVYEPTTIYKRK